jgi:DMSO/TMAO reductase YedYZ molybdopterin-dependent catalytic subunit|tara:strand:- start:14004 stop:14720 length:717 start_codon:yes stop_codon:yes gene_type:complete
MTLSRRDAIKVSGSAVAGLSMGVVNPENILGQAAPEQEWPDQLVEGDLRVRAELPLNSDGSAPEHPESAAGELVGTIWRFSSDRRQPPADIDYDYNNLRIKLDSRGLAKMSGTLKFSDLEALPRHSMVTLLQCGAPQPTGIVKWTGVRFSDFADMIGVGEPAHYCRLISHDGYYIDEEMPTLRHPQVMLAWMMNDEPLPPVNGAPIRLVMPFRYGARSIKAISEITFASPGFSARIGA